jgi:hypothetical protein
VKNSENLKGIRNEA